jgi:predicted RNA-binding Zn-ribbon protein involved in translation (DUF1610 family)
MSDTPARPDADTTRKHRLGCGCAAENDFVMYPCSFHSYLMRDRDTLTAERERLIDERNEHREQRHKAEDLYLELRAERERLIAQVEEMAEQMYDSIPKWEARGMVNRLEAENERLREAIQNEINRLRDEADYDPDSGEAPFSGAQLTGENLHRALKVTNREAMREPEHCHSCNASAESTTMRYCPECGEEWYRADEAPRVAAAERRRAALFTARQAIYDTEARALTSAGEGEPDTATDYYHAEMQRLSGEGEPSDG